MKYDVDGQLYLYLERNKLSRKVDSFIKLIDKKKLFRYDGDTKERTFTQYESECSIMHRFQAAESWITIVKNGCDISEQYDFPERKALFSFNRNNFVTLFTISAQLTSRCASVLGLRSPTKTNATKYKSPNVTILPMEPSRLSNSKLFMNTVIAKFAKNVKEHIHSTTTR